MLNPLITKIVMSPYFFCIQLYTAFLVILWRTIDNTVSLHHTITLYDK